VTLTTTLKAKPCAHCGSSFMPFRPMAQVCSPICARRKVDADKKAEKAQTKARKEAIETIPELIKKAQHAFNAYIRERDRGRPCICCGQPLGMGVDTYATADASSGGLFDCGHYRSTGSASHLRFHEDNAHAQRKHCNRYGAGRAVDYRIGLIARIGQEKVEALEADNAPIKWERDVLRQIAVIYRARLRDLLKAKA
jgi:hypothetical protein